MRNFHWMAAIGIAALASPAAAQTGGAAGAAAPTGAAAGAHAGAAEPAAGPQMATSHAETARRLMNRQAGAAADPRVADPRAADPRVAAAAKAADEALLNDPTVKAMVDGSMSRPPSLAGGAPVPPPPSRTPR
jgi:hypothetical protein